MPAVDQHHGTTLRRLRTRIGLTQHEMAARLGVALPTYRAYEYGNIRQVPANVMQVARTLSIDPEYSYITAMYGGRPMAEIAREWARRIGVKENSPTELARALGVNKSNTSRWLDPQADVKLTTAELIAYERRVAREEKYYQDSLKRHGRA